MSSFTSQQIDKLCHHVVNTRHRALDSILFKLKTDIIDINGIINDEKLFKHCIQWFYDEGNRNKFIDMLVLINDYILSPQKNNNYDQSVNYFSCHKFKSLLLQNKLKWNKCSDYIQKIMSKLNVSSTTNLTSSSTEDIEEKKETEDNYVKNNDNNGIKDNKMKNNNNDSNEWRFPYIELDKSDFDYLYDISLKLKVDNKTKVENALSQLEHLIIYNFPSEIILQIETNLFENILYLLNSNDYDLINRCIHFLIKFIQKITSSLYLRCDISIMSQTMSSFIKHYTSSQLNININDYQYPNDFNHKLINNKQSGVDSKHIQQFDIKNNISCHSISFMIDKLLTISIEKLLKNQDTKYMALQLINEIFNKFIIVKKKHLMSEKDINILINAMKSFQSFVESVDLTKIQYDIFMVQITQFITKCLSLCPQKYLNNRYIPSCINVILCAFAENVALSIVYPKLHKDVIQILQHLQPATYRKIRYVEYVLKAMEKLKGKNRDLLIKSNNLMELRSTFIALPFKQECVSLIMQSILRMNDNESSNHWISCISMLLLSPSNDIIIECLKCMHQFIRGNDGNNDINELISIDIIYILLIIIPKHTEIQRRVQQILTDLFSQNQQNMKLIQIYQKLYPLLSLNASNININTFKDETISFLNRLRLCFHSNAVIRDESHEIVREFYLKQIQENNENEEKCDQSDKQNPIRFANIDIDNVETVIKSLKDTNDLFHNQTMKKTADQYQKTKQQKLQQLLTGNTLKSDKYSGEENIKKLRTGMSRTSQFTSNYAQKIQYAQMLGTEFMKNRQFWYILRNEETLNILINCIIDTINDLKGTTNDSEKYKFMMQVLEIIKLRFETSMILDKLDCNDINKYEIILKQLLPTMFIPHETIRYLYSCIAALIVFHPCLLLSQSFRDKYYVQKEKERYSPKLSLIYDEASSSSNTKNKHQLFHIWIPKYVSNNVSLLFPHHPIKWTSYHTQSFEHVVKSPFHKQMIDGTQLYSQNDKIHLMIKQYSEIDTNNKVQFKKQYEMDIATKVLTKWSNCNNAQDYIRGIHQIMSLLAFSDFLNHFASQSLFYKGLEKYVMFMFILFCRSLPKNVKQKMTEFYTKHQFIHLMIDYLRLL